MQLPLSVLFLQHWALFLRIPVEPWDVTSWVTHIEQDRPRSDGCPGSLPRGSRGRKAVILTVVPALSADPPQGARCWEGLCLSIILPPGVGILAGDRPARIDGEGSGRLESPALPG